MTIKKLSKKSNEDRAKKFIHEGGKTVLESQDNSNHDLSSFRFTLRIPKIIVKELDNYRKKEVGAISRNTWILQAIAEKLRILKTK